MTARHQIQRIARELACVSPENETCGYCAGSEQGDYGRCGDCDGRGYAWADTLPISTIQAARNRSASHPLSENRAERRRASRSL